jgi:hypothetical protein
MAKAQKPTINDVARLSGVSKKTVSRVINKSPLLNQATREKVEAVIAQLDYVPNPQARALALRRNFLIGLIHDNPNAQMVLGVQEGILDTIAAPNSRWWCARWIATRPPCSTTFTISSNNSASMASCCCRRFQKTTSWPGCAAIWAAPWCAWDRPSWTTRRIWWRPTTRKR